MSMRIVCKVLLFHVSILYMFRLQKTVVAERTEVSAGLLRSTDQAANFCTAAQGPEAYACTEVQNTATNQDQSVDDAKVVVQMISLLERIVSRLLNKCGYTIY